MGKNGSWRLFRWLAVTVHLNAKAANTRTLSADKTTSLPVAIMSAKMVLAALSRLLNQPPLHDLHATFATRDKSGSVQVV